MKKYFAIIFCLGFLNFAKANQIFFAELKMMREKSPGQQAGSARLQSSNDNAIAKKLFWLPSLSLSGGVQKVARDKNLSEVQVSPSWKAGASWNLFSGGADYYQKQSAELQNQAEKYNYQDDNLKVEAQLAAIIFQQLYLNDVIKSTQNLMKLREESHAIVLAKYKAGKVPFQEVEKSEIDKNQQETRLRSLQIENLDNQTQWRALFGEVMQTTTWPFTSSQDFIENNENKSSNLTSGNVRLVPELAKLENLSLASENYWKSTKSTYWPQLDFTLDYQTNLSGDDQSKIWTGGLYLTIPIWSKYETVAKVSSAYAEYLVNKNQFEVAKNLNAAKKENLSQKILLSKKNLEGAKNNLAKSEKLYADMLKSFSFGRISMNELLIEQNRLIDSQMGLSQSQWDYHKILLDACNVLGNSLVNCLN